MTICLPRARQFAAAILAGILLISAAAISYRPIQEANAAPGFTDFNGDGFEDLAIGVRTESVGNAASAGAVSVIYGSSSGLSATTKPDQFWTQNSADIEGTAEAADFFGDTLASGDFNGDGKSDLAIGAYGETVGTVGAAGTVNVIYGSSQGLKATPVATGDGRADQSFTQDSADIDDAIEVGDSFGSSLAAGDFNGDGRDDLAIGIESEDVGSITQAGAVQIIYGSATGLSATAVPDQFWTQDSPNIEDQAEQGDFFGQALAAGDFNKDGRDDLAIGTRLEDVGSANDAGIVQVVYGSVTGLSATAVPDQLFSQGGNIFDSLEATDRFGTAVATGDFNNDGYFDLAVGVPGESSGTISGYGVVHIILGSASGLTDSGDQLFHQDMPDIEDSIEADDQFGNSLISGDFNNDGKDDLAVGVVRESLNGLSQNGAVQIIYGASSGLSATAIPDQLWSQDSPSIKGTLEAGDRFGDSLAAGDFNKDGISDLVVGVPEENLFDTNDDVFSGAGLINVIYGTASGLAAAGNQVFNQNTAQVEDNPESVDHFGASLASG